MFGMQLSELHHMASPVGFLVTASMVRALTGQKQSRVSRSNRRLLNDLPLPTHESHSEVTLRDQEVDRV